MDAPEPTAAGLSESSDPRQTPALSVVERGLIAAAVVVSVVARLATRSPLWLDEALSVNIARLPIGDLVDALRHDGHPPLYYVVLHYWMAVFGEGDGAVRALSTLCSVASLPLAFEAGRRRAGTAGAWAVLLVVAIAPFSVRYGSETRMYALVSLLVLAAVLVAEDLHRQPSRWRWLGLVALTGAALWTHYWSVYLGLAAVVVLAWTWRRGGDRAGAVRVASALAVGAVTFVPWLPTLAYQAAHTGTPWGTASRPTQAVVDLATGLGGEGFSEAVLLGIVVFVLAAIGLWARGSDRHRLVLDFRTADAVRLEMALVILTASIGLGVGILTSSTFVPRYAAVFAPMLFVAAGVGLARLSAPTPRRVAAVGLIGLAAIGVGANTVRDRTQGAEVATAIQSGGGSGLVVFCPDQLGPSTLRALGPDVEAVGLPSLERPERIDWVDYESRNTAADPAEVTRDVLETAQGRTIWLVVNYSYRTYEGFCEAVQGALTQARPANEAIVVIRDDVYEPANLIRFDP